MWKNTTERYGNASVAFHWLMLLLLAAVYACIELRVLFPKGDSVREALKMWHYMLGLSVFTLVWFRLAISWSAPTPAIVPDPARWAMLSAKAMHVGLYALMIGMPLAGWAILSAEGKDIPFYGLHLPALFSPDKPLGEQIKEIHETAGTVGYFLIGAHALASLFHHYISHDNTLRRMLPVRK